MVGLGRRLAAQYAKPGAQSRVPDPSPQLPSLEHSQPSSSRSILGHPIRPLYSSSAQQYNLPGEADNLEHRHPLEPANRG